jgi:hypothetical protein
MNYDGIATAMDMHMDETIQTPWFLRDLADFLGTVPDLSRIEVWLGDPRKVYLKPGQVRKYITFVFVYGEQVIAYEQDSLNYRSGICRELIVSS